jgi:hypothetical protein
MFPSATAELIQARRLDRRVDTKFVLSEGEAEALMIALQGDYAVVLAGEQPEAHYENLYFDSADFVCLRDHYKGRRPRFKVRVRHHLERALSFLETKEKQANERTLKSRQTRCFRDESLQADALAFIEEHSRLAANTLIPAMRIDFSRTTLVGIETAERITIDRNLRFARGEEEAELAGGIIVEVKQPRLAPRSPVMRALREVRALPLSISKYCTGAQLLLPSVNPKQYNPKLRLLRRRFA